MLNCDSTITNCEKQLKVLQNEANQSESNDRTDCAHNPSDLTTAGATTETQQRPPHLQTWASGPQQ